MSTIKVDTITDTSGNSSPIIKGAVLQVQYTQYTDTFTQSYTADTNAVIGAIALSVNITPKSTSSIIKLDAHIFHEFSDFSHVTDHVWFFYRDTTVLKPPSAGNRPCGISISRLSHSSDAGSTPETVYYSYLMHLIQLVKLLIK